ncbi:MAG TPA: hypothetical protein VL983_11525 [Terriglobales bacterium]|nr:hypothetical protein [Terriglobales bacterium]
MFPSNMGSAVLAEDPKFDQSDPDVNDAQGQKNRVHFTHLVPVAIAH